MFKLIKEETVVVVVDVQEKLIPAMVEEVVVEVKDNIRKLVEGAKVAGVPVVVTQQYTKGLGDTVEEIREVAGKEYIEKTSFSCCGEKAFIEALKNKGAKTVVVTGMETHVCVLQTVVDLLDAGFNVHVAADAVCSRSEFNWDVALRYMERAGAVITVSETVLFQLVKDAKAPEFKAISKLVK